MMAHFTEAEKAIHYPSDRRSFVALKPYMLIIFFLLIIGLPGIAWLQYFLLGLPADISLHVVPFTNADPSGFPIWINLSHWVNFFFLVLIIRSGL
jgi:sulfoxide reductase catalytic subunit YedY